MGTRSSPAPSQSDSPPAGGDESTLGELLRSARERRGLSLQRVFDETKIPLKHLDALERNNFAALPPAVYLRSEVRSYAKTVHLDPDLALRALDRALAPPAPAPVVQTPQLAPPSPSTSAPRRRALVAAIGLALIAGVLTVVVWKRGVPPAPGDGSGDSSRNVPSPPTSQAPATPAVAPLVNESNDAAPAPASTSGAITNEGQSGTPPLPSEQPTPETAAPESTGEAEAQLTITTQPAGARVTINGIGWGTSPVTIRNLSPGSKRVRASLDGYAAAERVLDLGGGQRSKVTIRLRAAEER